MKASTAAVWLALSLAGCTGKDSSGVADSAGEPSICAITPGPGVDASTLDCDIGTGGESFIDIEEGDEVPYYQGIQGAWHVFESLRVKGVAPGDPADLTDPDTPYVLFLAYKDGEIFGGIDGFFQPRGLTEVGDGWYEFVGETVLLQISEQLEAAGYNIELFYELHASDGSVLSARMPVTLYFGGVETGPDTGDTGGTDGGSTGGGTTDGGGTSGGTDGGSTSGDTGDTGSGGAANQGTD